MNVGSLKMSAMDLQRIHCSKCGDPIGFWPEDLRGFHQNIYPLPRIRCPGKGAHPSLHEVTETIRGRFVERFTLHYPETPWLVRRGYRFVGPPFLPFLFIAIFLGVRRAEHECYKKIYIGGKLLIFTPLARNFYTRKYWSNVRKLLCESHRIFP